jgi:hypothetical protein
MTANNEATLKIIAHLKAMKKAANEAKEALVEAEEAIVQHLEAYYSPAPESGQKTYNIGGESVTVKRGFNHRANMEGIEKVFASRSELPPPIKTKTTRELDTAGYEWYRTNHPALFLAISEHVTVTPKKVSVAVRE